MICLVLLVVALRAPARRRWPYLVGTLTSAVFVFALTPFVETIGSHPLWVGPTIPVIGQLDVTSEELRAGLYQALRLAAVGLAFADYALLVDHDRLLASAGGRAARRSPWRSRPASSRRSSATRATCSSRCAAAASAPTPCG